MYYVHLYFIATVYSRGFLYFTLLTEPSLTWFTWKELSGAWFTPYVELFVQFQKIRSVVRNFYDISNGHVWVKKRVEAVYHEIYQLGSTLSIFQRLAHVCDFASVVGFLTRVVRQLETLVRNVKHFEFQLPCELTWDVHRRFSEAWVSTAVQKGLRNSVLLDMEKVTYGSTLTETWKVLSQIKLFSNV